MAKPAFQFLIKRPRTGKASISEGAGGSSIAGVSGRSLSDAAARHVRLYAQGVSTSKSSQRALAPYLDRIIRDVSIAAATASIESYIEKVGAPNLSRLDSAADVQQLLERTPIRRLDLVQERLQQRMVTAVLNGTPWLSSTEVGALGQGGVAPSNPHARASRLLNEGKVFAIERAGRKEFPRYAFDALGNPYPVVREVLQVFAGWSALRVASWFESAGAALDGKRPRELLELDPQAVVRAAKEHGEGPVHG
jgi:hypothetical protein